MPAPTPLVIAAQAVQRLVKEETYYQKDLKGQESRVTKLEADIKAGSPDLDDNADFVLQQEKAAIAETQAIFGPLRVRIEDAVSKLEEQIAISESDGNFSVEEMQKAKDALKSAQTTSSTKDKEAAVAS